MKRLRQRFTFWLAGRVYAIGGGTLLYSPTGITFRETIHMDTGRTLVCGVRIVGANVGVSVMSKGDL